MIKNGSLKLGANPQPLTTSNEFSNTWDGIEAAAKKAGAKFPGCGCCSVGT